MRSTGCLFDGWRAANQALLSLLIVLLTLLNGAATGALDEPEWDGTLRRVRVPILMYHYVSELPPDADPIRIDLTVTPANFRAHMQHLRDEGYTPVSLYDLHAALLTGQPLPARPVILTFDDGHIDHYIEVFPVLREFGFTGTFFIITGLVDSNAPDYITWAQAAEMAEAGMSLEPHTKTHRDLRERSDDLLVYEMLGSRESLNAHTISPARMFSYPAGRYDEATLRVARDLDIWRAVTTQPGLLHTTDNWLELPRVRVSYETGVAGLAHLLSGAWLEQLKPPAEPAADDDEAG